MLDDRGAPVSASSYERVETPLYCVLTRIRLRHFWHLPVMWLAYLRIRRQSRDVPGLVRSAFLVQDVRTFFILSVWEGEQGYAEFGAAAPSHVDAARDAFRTSATSHGDELQIWSIEWRAWAAGYHLNWDGVDAWYRLLGIPPRSRRPED